MMSTQTKKDIIDKMMLAVEKDFGKGNIMRLADRPDVNPEDVIPTGSLGLDIALGIGGLPKGRIVEIFGPESSGKTTLAIHVMAEAQKQGGTVGFIDAEHAFDKKYAENLGVNVDDLIISQPDYGEQGLEIADRMIQSGAFAVVVVDSVAALVPKGELDGGMGDNKMGLHARLMSQALRKLTGAVAKTNTLLIFINQLREKIGVMFGSPETTTGGNALKFYASVRLDVRRKIGQSLIKDGEGSNLGHPVIVKVIKNKTAPPFTQAEFSIHFGKGIDSEAELLSAAVDLDIISKSGSWYSYDGAKIGQGSSAVQQFMTDNPELAAEIKQKVKDKVHVAT